MKAYVGVQFRDNEVFVGDIDFIIHKLYVV